MRDIEALSVAGVPVYAERGRNGGFALLPGFRGSGADRTYRLSRVLAAEELDEPAQRPEQVDLDRAWQQRSTQFRTGGDQVTVLVRVNPAWREDLVRTALAVRSEEADADGWLRLEVTFQDQRHAE